MKKDKNKELVSLNSELPELYVEELEQRLETDPLMLSGLLDTNMQRGFCGFEYTCNSKGGCEGMSLCPLHWD